MRLGQLNHQTNTSGAVIDMPENMVVINAANKGNYDFVEGVVSDTVALDNKNELQSVIDDASALGKGLSINDIDMYLNVTNLDIRHSILNAINLPSNFDFEIKPNTHLRVQPNGRDGYMMISAHESDSVTIYGGGTLWGDRYTHDYTTLTSTHDWGHLIMFKGTHDSTIDGIILREGSGDGFITTGTAHRENDGTIKLGERECNNVTIKNCVIDDNRRNNISIVDGTDIYIEYNTIINSGSGIPEEGFSSSNGTSPRAGIDIEAYKGNAADGNSIYELQETQEVHIRYNTFEDNYSVDLLFFNGENTYAYNNTFKSEFGVSTSYGFNNKVYNNTFENADGNKGIAIEAKFWANGNHRITDWEIYGNTIEGFQFAMIIGGEGQNIHDNTLTDNERGITILDIVSSAFTNNNISSVLSSSYGYRNFFGVNNDIISTTITGGDVSSVTSNGISFHTVNDGGSGGLVINGVVIGALYLNTTTDFTVQNCSYTSFSNTSNTNLVLTNNNP